MKSLNKIQLIGWLGADPKIISLKDGTLFARMRLATNTFIHQKEGEPKKFTEWHTIVVWSQTQIETLKNYLIKGSHILIDGRIVYRTYEDKSGHKRYVTEIRANYLVDLDR